MPAFGGAASVGENIINQLKIKYDFTVYSVSSHTHLNTGNYDGYKQIVFKCLAIKKINSIYYYLRSLLHVLFFSKYDIIHLHHRDAAFIIPILKLKYKVILTTHGIFNCTDKWKNHLWYFHLQEKYFVKYANIITCVSRTEQELIKRKLNLMATCIPNGVDAGHRIFNRSPLYNMKISFAAGRIIRVKGLHILLTALNLIKFRGELIIAGDLEQDKNYKKELLELGEKLNIIYFGLVKDKKYLLEILSNTLFFVFPSTLEAMSMMLLETASIKIPIICSDIKENKDIFKDYEVLFFNNNDAGDLAKKIQFALSNRTKMLEFAENAFQKVQKEYSIDIMAMQYDALYKKLLS